METALRPLPTERPEPVAGIDALRPVSTTRSILLASHKGGVGKSVTTANVAAALGEWGRRVLLVDIDPNGGLTASFGRKAGRAHPGLYGVEAHGLEKLVLREVIRNVDLLPYPGDRRPLDLDAVYVALRGAAILAHGDYDLILIDSRPAVPNMARRLCQAVDAVLVLFQCHHLAYRTLAPILRELREARFEGAGAQFAGLLLTMVDLTDPGQARLEAEIRKSLGGALLPTSIPLDPAVSEALMHGQPVVTFRPHSAAAWAYRKISSHLAGSRV
jgi:chromosome partitioning protein